MTCQHTSGQVLYTRVQTNRFTSTNKFTSMSPERLVQAKQIFDRALELPQSERQLFVQKACAGDLDLESTIAALLSQDPEEIPSILATPGVASENAKTLPLESPILKNRYQIIKELDRGGMGVVFLAADLQLHNRPVVVKMLSDRLTNDSWYRAKFFQEIQVLARISHPCVVSVLDAGETSNGHPFLVMEYVEGIKLVQLINPQGADFIEAAALLRQIGHGLAAAHALGVCHRDLKPENILLQTLGQNERHVKLIDFGISALMAEPEGSRATKLVGTLPYMAPEQLEGKATISGDVYSFAVIAYELLLGQLPYLPESPVDLYKLQQAQSFNRPSAIRPDLPAGVEALLIRALAFHPQDRFASAWDFSNALVQALLQSARQDRISTPLPRQNQGRIVPKMCDRRSQEDDFKSFYQTHRASQPGIPQICIIHGEEGECHESLVERLTYFVERTTQQEPGRPAPKLKKVPGQYDGSAEVRQRRLLSWLSEQLIPNRPVTEHDISPAGFGKLLFASRAPVWIFQHEVRVARWDVQTPAFLRLYTEFLGKIDTGGKGPQLLVFLNVIYPAGAPHGSRLTEWFRSGFQGATTKKRVADELRALTGLQSPCPRLLLDELRPVTKDDVMEWLSLHNIYDSQEQRMQVSDSLFLSGGRRLLRKSMAEIESRLHQLHQSYMAERGFL